MGSRPRGRREVRAAARQGSLRCGPPGLGFAEHEAEVAEPAEQEPNPEGETAAVPDHESSSQEDPALAEAKAQAADLTDSATESEAPEPRLGEFGVCASRRGR